MQGFSVPPLLEFSCTFEMRPQDRQNVKHDLGGRTAQEDDLCVNSRAQGRHNFSSRGGEGGEMDDPASPDV